MLGVTAFGTGLICGLVLSGFSSVKYLKKKRSANRPLVAGNTARKAVMEQPIDAELDRRPTFFIPSHAAVLIVE